MTNCWHIYGVMPDGSQVYLYSDCSTTYNWILTYLTPGGGFNFDAPPTGGVSTGNPGGSPGGTEITNLNPCPSDIVPTCSYVVTYTPRYVPNCQVNVRISGCTMNQYDFFLTGLCTHPVSSGNNQLEILNKYVYTTLTNVYNASATWDPNCLRLTERCGGAFVSFTYTIPFWGIHTGITQLDYFSERFCYYCVDCP